MISVYESTFHHLLYAEPQEYFVEIHRLDPKARQPYLSSIDHKHFNLAMPGLVLYSQKTQWGMGPPCIVSVRDNPIKDGILGDNIEYFYAPLPHTRAATDICMRISASDPRERFSLLWLTKSKYWLNMQLSKYVDEHYEEDVFYWKGHGLITGYKFFEEWESRYNIDNIPEAPFCNMPVEEKYYLDSIKTDVKFELEQTII